MVTLSSLYIKFHIVSLWVHKGLRFSFVCAITLYRASLYTLKFSRLLFVYNKIFIIIIIIIVIISIMYLH